MDRYTFCERALRQIYGEQPTDDSNITVNLVNSWLNDAIAAAAKKNWTDNLQIDQIAFVNNSFYTTFSALPIISTPEQFIYQMTLPQIPIGIGKNEGVGILQFVDSSGFVSDPAIPLSEAQISIYRNMRPIPNKILYFSESTYVYAITTLQLFSPNYTGKIRMISGGDSTNLDSLLNVPDDYFAGMVEYIKMQLSFSRAQPKDLQNDGADN